MAITNTKLLQKERNTHFHISFILLCKLKDLNNNKCHRHTENAKHAKHDGNCGLYPRSFISKWKSGKIAGKLFTYLFSFFSVLKMFDFFSK